MALQASVRLPRNVGVIQAATTPEGIDDASQQLVGLDAHGEVDLAQVRDLMGKNHSEATQFWVITSS